MLRRKMLNAWITVVVRCTICLCSVQCFVIVEMLLLMASRSRFQPTYDLMLMIKINKITAMMLLAVLLHVRKRRRKGNKKDQSCLVWLSAPVVIKLLLVVTGVWYMLGLITFVSIW